MLRLPIRSALMLALTVLAVPVQAQTLDQLDALVDAAADEAGGIALAQDQARRSQYLEALSTLERVLGSFPTSRAALLDHAAYLCMIDDLQGGRVELQLLRERDYDARQFSDAQAICDGVATVLVPTPAPPPVQAPASSNNAASSSNSKPKVN